MDLQKRSSQFSTINISCFFLLKQITLKYIILGFKILDERFLKVLTIGPFPFHRVFNKNKERKSLVSNIFHSVCLFLSNHRFLRLSVMFVFSILMIFFSFSRLVMILFLFYFCVRKFFVSIYQELSNYGESQDKAGCRVRPIRLEISLDYAE